MSLALFDLDNTLLAGDSDYEWGQFLADIGVVDKAVYAQTNARFHRDYLNGHLDIHAFSRFAFQVLADHSLVQLKTWRATFLKERIEPLIAQPARDLVEHHRQRGDTLVVITATNSFVTQPIADLFGIPHLIATEPKFDNGRFYPEIDGIPAFREGKTQRLFAWLDTYPQGHGESWFYSDSHNDLPLLEWVNHPCAVDPDEQLTVIAQDRGWRILHLHQHQQPVTS